MIAEVSCIPGTFPASQDQRHTRGGSREKPMGKTMRWEPNAGKSTPSKEEGNFACFQIQQVADSEHPPMSHMLTGMKQGMNS